MNFIRSIFHVGFGTLFSQILLILSAPILARLVAPSEFGLANIVFSITAILSVIANLRLEQAVVIPSDESQACKIVTTALTVSTLLSLLVVSLSLCWQSEIAIWLQLSSSQGLIFFIPLIVWLTGVLQPLRAQLVRHGRFRLLGISWFVQTAATILIQILLILFLNVAGTLSLVIGASLGLLLVIVYILVIARANIGCFKWQPLSQHRHILSKYRAFALYNVPYSFATQAGKRAILLILASFAAERIVGIYALALKLVFLPVGLVASAINQVYYRTAAGNLPKLEKELLANRLILAIVYILAPAVFIFAEEADQISQLFLGSEWVDVGKYSVALLPAAFCLLLTSWLDRLYDVHGRQRLAMALELGYNLIILTSFGVLIAYVDPLTAVWGYSLMTGIYNLIWLFVTFRIAGFSLKRLSITLYEIAILLSAISCYLYIGPKFTELTFAFVQGFLLVVFIALLGFHRHGKYLRLYW